MTTSIQSLGESIETREIVFRGETLTLHPIFASDYNVLLAALPAPMPPMKRDPARGSLARKIPDEDNPEYVAALRRHRDVLVCTAIAISARWKDSLSRGWLDVIDKNDDISAWAFTIYSELSKVTTALEIAALDRAVWSVNNGEGINEDAAKNS